MYADPAELQLKRQLEQALGRSITDDEWESFKRAASASPATQGSAATRQVHEGMRRVGYVVASLGLLASVGLFVKAGFMFSLAIRITLGVYLWLLALVLLRMWLVGFRSSTGFLAKLAFLVTSFFWEFSMFILFGLGGSFLFDRASVHKDAAGAGVGLVLVSIVLGVVLLDDD